MEKKLLNALTVAVLFLMPVVNLGQASDPGSSSSFALFTPAGAFSKDGASVITGDIGIDKQANLTSVNDVGIANTIDVYPNPAKNELNIVSENNLKSIILFNFIGETIYNETVSGNKVQVDVSGYLPGLYFIQIQTHSGLLVKRVTIH